MADRAINSTAGRDEGLTDYLTAKNADRTRRRRETAKPVNLNAFQVQNSDQFIDRVDFFAFGSQAILQFIESATRLLNVVLASLVGFLEAKQDDVALHFVGKGERACCILTFLSAQYS